MTTRSAFARAGAALGLAALLVGTTACGRRAGDERFANAVLRVTLPSGAAPAVMSKVRALEGVAFVAGVAFVDVDAHGSSAARVTLAVTEPDEIGAVASGLLADGAGVAAGLHAGQVLMPAGERERLGIPPGAVVEFRDARGKGTPGARPIAVGELSDALAGIATGVVSRDHVRWLRPGAPTLLLVGVTLGYDPNGTAAALAARLDTDVGVSGPLPSFLTGRAVSRLFGSFSYTVNGDGTITQSAEWVRRNIVTARMPILGTVRCHRLMIRQLARALGEIKRAGLAGLIDVGDFRTAGGCYVARQMLWDPAKPPSMHAWGLAIDINVARNQYGARPTQDPRVVAVFERWGFAWGGRWSTPDGMHFELAALLRT